MRANLKEFLPQGGTQNVDILKTTMFLKIVVNYNILLAIFTSWMVLISFPTAYPSILTAQHQRWWNNASYYWKDFAAYLTNLSKKPSLILLFALVFD